MNKRIFGNFTFSAIIKFVTLLSPVLLSPLMISTWGIDGYGEWILLTSIPSYLMLSSDLGLVGVAVNDVPRLRFEGKAEEAYLLFRIIFISSVFIAIAFIVLSLIFAFNFSFWAEVGVEVNSSMAPFVVLFSCMSIAGFQLIGMCSAGFRGEDLSVEFSFYLFLYYSILLILSIVLLLLNLDMLTYSFFVMAYAYIFSFLLFWRLYVRNRNYFKFPSVSELAGIRSLVGKGFGHGMFPVLHAFQNQGVLLIIGATAGASVVALFQTLRVLTNGFKSIIGVIAIPVMIEIPRLVGERSFDRLFTLLKMSSLFSFAMLCLFTIGMFAFGEDIYRLWLGDGVVFDAGLLSLLIISLWFFVFGNTSTLLLLCTNSIQSVALLLLLATLFVITLTWFFATSFGVHGAAIGVIFFELMVAVLVWFGSRKLRFVSHV